MLAVSTAYLAPVAIVFYNSFKSKLFISSEPFNLPTKGTSVGFDNYIEGVQKIEFFKAFGYSLFITVFSVAAIVLFTAMTAWFITRMKTKVSKFLYYSFVFSMIERRFGF